MRCHFQPTEMTFTEKTMSTVDKEEEKLEGSHIAGRSGVNDEVAWEDSLAIP